MKTLFYYVRDYKTVDVKTNEGGADLRISFPVRIATVCLVTDGQDYARGFSVCSRKDQFCKRVGRSIAEGRALAAFRKRRTHNYLSWPFDPPPGAEYLVYKSDFFPHLTDFEKRLIDRNWKREKAEEKGAA